MAGATRLKLKPLGDISRTALTSDQGAKIFQTFMLLIYSITRSLQQPVMKMRCLREKRHVLSAPHKGSIKQTNTSQVLVSETVPDRRVQLSREAKKTRFQDNLVSSTVPVPPKRQPGCDTSTRNRRKFKLDVTDPDLLVPLKQTGPIQRLIPIKQTAVTKRHSDLREPQPSLSDSQPASSQLDSVTTTSESSVSLPSSLSGSSSTESTSTSSTDSSSTDRSFFQHLACWYQREARTHIDKESNGQLERPTATYHHTEASCHAATKPTKACLSASSCKYATSTISPKTSK